MLSNDLLIYLLLIILYQFCRIDHTLKNIN
nr:MAG TPA: hypothetical protein [Caudoviricetes sp.]